MTRWNHRDVFGPETETGKKQWAKNWSALGRAKRLKTEPCPHCGQKMRHGQCAWCEPEGDNADV